MSKPKLKLIPLGGLGEIGKNMMVVEYDNEILLIDSGIMFPENDMLGIDYIIPDFHNYLQDRHQNVRGIVVTISTEYFKKARGTLMAECRCYIPSVTEDIEYQVVADIHDAQQDLVARTTVTWRLGLTTQ